MGYNEYFYKKYAEYLREDSVRTSHDFAFDQFQKLAGKKLRIIDFGCGLGEYQQHGSFSSYVGVDVNNLSQNFKLIQENYRNLDTIKTVLSSCLVPDAFVSLFSVECFNPVIERYAFYHRVFETFPHIRFGFVSGFFYKSKHDQETVGETGGIVSYQTIEDPSLYMSDMFAEFRMHIQTPSQMFGQDVVEIWKFFIRR